MDIQLLDLAHFYKDYFLQIKYKKAGAYVVNGETAHFVRDWLTIVRPGLSEDWTIIVEWHDDHYFAHLSEHWAGSVVTTFCFKDVGAITDIVPVAQSLIERLTSLHFGEV